mgnify:CR=1 FL=1
MLALGLVIGVGVAIYTWGFRAAVDTGRAEITLKNVGTVDITSLTVKVIEADGSKLDSPLELTVNFLNSFSLKNKF